MAELADALDLNPNVFGRAGSSPATSTMRNIHRIERILNKLDVIWLQYPDYRFFQLLSFIKGELLEVEDTADMFYLEDDELELVLDDYITLKLNK